MTSYLATSDGPIIIQQDDGWRAVVPPDMLSASRIAADPLVQEVF